MQSIPEIIDLLNATYGPAYGANFDLRHPKDRALAEFLAALMTKLAVTLP